MLIYGSFKDAFDRQRRVPGRRVNSERGMMWKWLWPTWVLPWNLP